MALAAPPLDVVQPAWDPVCLECGLCHTSKAVQVFGEGNPSSPLVLLGEALGEDEEAQQRPFVGRAGWILDRALRDAGLIRREVFITNAAKCRPINAVGKNRPPTVDELTQCRHWLDEELGVLPNKRVIVAMGASALWAALYPHVPAGGVMENQGRTFWSERYQCTVVSTVHPALALRKPGEAQWLPLDFAKAAEIVRVGRPPALKQPRFRVVRTPLDFMEMEMALARAPYLVWDWETAPNRATYGDAVHPKQAIGYCVSFCGEADFAWVVPRYGANMAPLWARRDLPLVDDALRRIFLSPTPKIGHHVAFDYIATLSTLGVRPVNVVGCTMLAHHTLYNHYTERAHGLKRMADVYTPYGRYDDEIDQWLRAHGYTKDGKPDGAYTYRVPGSILWKYNAIDSIVPWLIHPILEERLRAADLWTLYQEERVPLALEYAEMDRYGVPVSRPYLVQMSAGLSVAMDAVKDAIGRMVLTWKCPTHGRVFHVKCCAKAKGGTKKDGYPGAPLNPNSGQQVAEYLYNYQGLPILARTDSGQPSTKEEVLRQFEDEDPLVPPILHYRSYTKLKGTYVDGKTGQGGILVAVDPDGYVHPSTLLTAVETFRLATRKPFPVHLIPRPLPVWHCPEHGRYFLGVRIGDRMEACCPAGIKTVLNLRGMVRPRSDSEVLLSADYSQQEYVLAAIAAHQTDMEEACLDRGEDAHAFVMQRMSGRSKREFQDANGQWLSRAAEAEYSNLRSAHKSLNFMVLYLGGAAHLAKSLKITEAAAAEMIAEYYARLPRIREWQQRIITTLHATGQVQGLFKAVRRLPNVYSPFRNDRVEAERQACNFPFQSGGAHTTFRGLLRLSARWRRERFPGRVLFTVHDEIVAIVRRTAAAEGAAMMQAEMERPHPELVGGCGIPRGIRASVKAVEEWGGPSIETVSPT